MKGNPAFKHHVIAEDDETITFLNKYPTLRGYTLVCPKAHREDLADDLSPEEYLRLQAKVHRVARALKKVFDAERLYVLSLGSQQANKHLHFHVAENGVLQIADEEMAAIAREIGAAYRQVT